MLALCQNAAYQHILCESSDRVSTVPPREREMPGVHGLGSGLTWECRLLGLTWTNVWGKASLSAHTHNSSEGSNFNGSHMTKCLIINFCGLKDLCWHPQSPTCLRLGCHNTIECESNHRKLAAFRWIRTNVCPWADPR